jgi:hypothetical protein
MTPTMLSVPSALIDVSPCECSISVLPSLCTTLQESKVDVLLHVVFCGDAGVDNRCSQALTLRPMTTAAIAFDRVLSCACIMRRMHTAYICKCVFGNHVPVRCVEHAVVEASDALRKRLHHCCFVFWVNDVAKSFWSVDRLPVGNSNVEPVAAGAIR